eukprot:761776-Hanusia_phi.AAC.1
MEEGCLLAGASCTLISCSLLLLLPRPRSRPASSFSSCLLVVFACRHSFVNSYQGEVDEEPMRSERYGFFHDSAAGDFLLMPRKMVR